MFLDSVWLPPFKEIALPKIYRRPLFEDFPCPAITGLCGLVNDMVELHIIHQDAAYP